VEGVDTQLLAAGSDVLSSQHGSVGGGFVTVSLDLHTTGDTADSFAAAGITQNISLCMPSCGIETKSSPRTVPTPMTHGKKVRIKSIICKRTHEPEIGDMDESVVEGGKDTGDTEVELACIMSVRLRNRYAPHA